MWILIFFVILTIVSVSIGVSRQPDPVLQRRNQVRARHATDELYVSDQDGTAVGINFVDQKIVLGKPGSDGVYDFAQIVAVEVLENGATISSTNRGSQLAGAAVGGLLFGGLGAVVGGLSGSKTSRQRISSIVLKIAVDDRYEPVQYVSFMHVGGQGVEPGHPLVTEAREAAERVHAHLVNAMRRVQSQQARLASPPAADTGQLAKLWDMRQAGALTQAEFDQQKQLLLAGSAPAPAISPPPKGRRYRVLLVHPGSSRLKFTKAIMTHVPEIVELNIPHMMQNLPYAILRSVDEQRAFAVRDALSEAGATVELI